MDVVNCPHCGAEVKITSTSLAFPCTGCGKPFNPKYPDGAPVKGFTKYEPRNVEGAKTGGNSAPFMKKPAVRIALGVFAVFALAMALLRFTDVLGIVLDSEPEGPAGWHKYRSDAAGFTAWFPAEPKAQTQEGAGLLGTVHTVTCESGATRVELSHERLIALFTIDFDETVRLTMQSCEGRLRERKRTKHQGVPAIFASGDSPRGEVRMLALEANKTLYVLVVFGSEAVWDDAVDCFYLDRQQRIAPD